LLNKTNHVPPDRRRCFYLALLSSLQNSPDTAAILRIAISALKTTMTGAQNVQQFLQPDCNATAAFLQPRCGTVTRGAMERDHRAVVDAAIERAPRWIKLDLAAKDDATRQRAEDALAMIIAMAIEGERSL